MTISTWQYLFQIFLQSCTSDAMPPTPSVREVSLARRSTLQRRLCYMIMKMTHRNTSCSAQNDFFHKNKKESSLSVIHDSAFWGPLKRPKPGYHVSSRWSCCTQSKLYQECLLCMRPRLHFQFCTFSSHEKVTLRGVMCAFKPAETCFHACTHKCQKLFL